MKYFTIQYDHHVAEVILSNPQKYNMLSPAWAMELEEILHILEQNDNVRVVLFWAEGKLFTAGLDLAEFAKLVPKKNASPAVKNLEFFSTLKAFQRPFTKLEKFKKPVVVAIHNKCIGGGVDFITACDIRMCTSDASFSIKETQIGMVADLGTIPRIVRIVGKGIYNEMVFTGEPLEASRALQTGFVNSVFEDKEKLLEGARKLCTTIAANSPLAVQGTKHVLRYAEEHSFDDTLAYIGLWNSAFIESEDLKEAATAFFQKRKPVFVNKL